MSREDRSAQNQVYQMTETEQVRLTPQEAKVIALMRELPYQTITIKIEAGKVVHKEQIKSIKD